MNLKAIKTLSLLQWRYLFRAYLKLWWVQLRLKFGRAEWLKQRISLSTQPGARLSDEPAGAPDMVEQLAIAEQIKEAVRLAARCHFWRTACLPQSLVLAELLQQRGLAAAVKLGVQKPAGDSGALASHAWVEVDGVLVGEPESVAEDFSQLSSLSDSNSL